MEVMVCWQHLASDTGFDTRILWSQTTGQRVCDWYDFCSERRLIKLLLYNKPYTANFKTILLETIGP